MQVEPVGYYYEGAFCSKRPVHDPETWAFKVEKVLKNNYTGSLLPEHVDWNGSSLWPAWRRWFEDGVK